MAVLGVFCLVEPGFNLSETLAIYQVRAKRFLKALEVLVCWKRSSQQNDEGGQLLPVDGACILSV